MHMVRANYGPAASAQVASAASSAIGVHRVASAHGGGLLSARGPVGDISDSDDVESLVQRVRRDVSAMQHAGIGSQDGRSARGDPRRDPRLGAQQDRPLSRSFSEATWDRPKTREKEEEVPRARPVPKAHVRGRYVFSAGAENQVLGGGLSLPGAAEGSALDTEFSSQFSPRPREGDRRVSPGRPGMGSRPHHMSARGGAGGTAGVPTIVEGFGTDLLDVG
mmetsp:Transcript_46571/g.84164  ORF Transcript_46571/g.84164 Transcript_46571/m.84164 type:complete len:221 (+) Transcript_46571:65-727(+)